MIIGNALQQQESHHGMASRSMESAARNLEGIADSSRQRADAVR